MKWKRAVATLSIVALAMSISGLILEAIAEKNGDKN